MAKREAWDNPDAASIGELRREYHEHCESLASDIVEDWKERNDGSDLSDIAHEWIDGHEWVIYTYKAGLVALCSSNHSAWQDCYPEKEKPSDEVVAYFAMMADVQNSDAYRSGDE